MNSAKAPRIVKTTLGAVIITYEKATAIGDHVMIPARIFIIYPPKFHSFVSLLLYGYVPVGGSTCP
jgi:hypothetical protein